MVVDFALGGAHVQFISIHQILPVKTSEKPTADPRRSGPSEVLLPRSTVKSGPHVPGRLPVLRSHQSLVRDWVGDTGFTERKRTADTGFTRPSILPDVVAYVNEDFQEVLPPLVVNPWASWMEGGERVWRTGTGVGVGRVWSSAGGEVLAKALRLRVPFSCHTCQGHFCLGVVTPRASGQPWIR